MSLVLVGEESDVTAHRFTAEVDGHPVPGLLWRPAGRDLPRATVLIGHGRTSHKQTASVVDRAHRLAGRGFAVAAIDAPGHGDRREPDATEWPRPDQGRAVRDWHGALALLHDAAGLDLDRLGYWGVSMGTALGLALLAGDQRFRAAVLGLMHPDWPTPPGARIRADAAALGCPVLFLVNWDDQLVPRDSAFDLFDLLGNTDKRLAAYPGDHAQLPDEALAAAVAFLVERLDP
jgi:dienelactone hydrolase